MATTKPTHSGSYQALARLRLDTRLRPIAELRAAMAAPRGGWLRAVRKAMGMSTEDVAVRLVVTRSSVARMETSEQRDTIQLDTLRRIAQAMDCELACVLIPRTSLEHSVQRERSKAARQRAQYRCGAACHRQRTQEAARRCADLG
ncbi:MAG: helix-turn-helix domain-containing protein [Xanthomonadales bacterium]|nr:helix-turn-helix domain-containing protein [Xanthomonadales bacterium]MCC6560849.1 helix-turn-helix domain-containing protein [Xanthomonadales bacterium]